MGTERWWLRVVAHDAGEADLHRAIATLGGKGRETVRGEMAATPGGYPDPPRAGQIGACGPV